MQMKVGGVSRRDVAGLVGAAILLAVPAIANADVEYSYPNVDGLGSDQVKLRPSRLQLACRSFFYFLIKGRNFLSILR